MNWILQNMLHPMTTKWITLQLLYNSKEIDYFYFYQFAISFFFLYTIMFMVLFLYPSCFICFNYGPRLIYLHIYFPSFILLSLTLVLSLSLPISSLSSYISNIYLCFSCPRFSWFSFSKNSHLDSISQRFFSQGVAWIIKH